MMLVHDRCTRRRASLVSATLLHSLQRIVEGNQGGILRIDFSSDDLWIRAEARGKREAPDEAPTIAVVLVSAESGDICDDKKVERCPHVKNTRTLTIPILGTALFM